MRIVAVLRLILITALVGFISACASVPPLRFTSEIPDTTLIEDLERVTMWPTKETEPLNLENRYDRVLKTFGEVLRKEKDKKIGILFRNNKRETVVKCVLRKYNDGFCSILTGDGSYKTGLASELRQVIVNGVVADPIAKVIAGDIFSFPTLFVLDRLSELTKLQLSLVAGDGKVYTVELE